MIRLACISDGHGHLPQIEPADILLYSGDICGHCPPEKVNRFGTTCWQRPPVGGKDDIFFQMKWLQNEFSEWLNKIPVKAAVCVFGNHDFIGERARHLVPKSINCHMLYNEVVEVMGLKIFGSPDSLPFCGWAFNTPEEELERIYSRIPDDTDIFITHTPPYGYGDRAPDGRICGSKSLLERIKKVKPSLTVSGHLHSGTGVYPYDRGDLPEGLICNAAVLDEEYRLVKKPTYFDIDIDNKRISVVNPD